MTIAKRFLKVDVEISQEVEMKFQSTGMCTGFSTRHVWLFTCAHAMSADITVTITSVCMNDMHVVQ